VEAKEYSCSKREEEAPLLKIEDGDEPKPKKWHTRSALLMACILSTKKKCDKEQVWYAYAKQKD
jgi:hypothetical protein